MTNSTWTKLLRVPVPDRFNPLPRLSEDLHLLGVDPEQLTLRDRRAPVTLRWA